MSKKSKRAKIIRPMKQLEQGSLASSQVQPRLIERLAYAEQQVRAGDFEGCLNTCEPLLNSLPKQSEIRLDILALMGLAHGMLKNFQESLAIFDEAISIDPTRAEFWHNRGLASYNMGRLANTVRDLERAVELSKNDNNELSRRFAEQLHESRQELQKAMSAHGPDITLEEFAAREERFAQAVLLMKQEKWREAELMFRQLTGTKARVAPYWGNLGVSLMMQHRYDEADAAFKKSLFIDPDYPFARDNLEKLPETRRSGGPAGVKTINLAKGDDVQQYLTLYDKDLEGELTSYTVVEKSGHTVTSPRKRLGKQPPQYSFFLNPYQDARFAICPQCRGKTRVRKLSFVLNVEPKCITLLDQTARYCDTCDLLIVHQEELQTQLAIHLRKGRPTLIGHPYQVVGTVDPTEWDFDPSELSSTAQLIENLHDFREIITFSRQSGGR